ncbi:hypothetical protein E3N88_23210 [Mikania micrantha]|uniref:Uncharacterized protein n=1 Tax=Mikania micrantha TaxID=192012 RepID=A0A5N6NDS9_9ASTR|nr:hypothetical protein E3N88_23210 [Mikania micrantha]
MIILIIAIRDDAFWAVSRSHFQPLKAIVEGLKPCGSFKNALPSFLSAFDQITASLGLFQKLLKLYLVDLKPCKVVLMFNLA